MAYRFQRKEAVRAGFHRLVCQQSDAIVATLTEQERTDVHEARKRIKMLRAVVHLFRGSLKDGERQELTENLRKLSHLLAPSRDADVRLKIFSALLARSGTRAPRSCIAVKKHLEQEARSAQREVLGADDAAHGIQLARKIRERACELRPHDSGWKAIERGLRRAYGHARKAAVAPLAGLPDEERHEWRRQVKDLWNFCRMLESIRPRKMRELIDQLDTLAELLGDDHDLGVLAAYLRKRGWLPPVMETFIGEERDVLAAEVTRLGGIVYEEKAKAFLKRVERWWKRWRKG